jgi:hypothetical protein
VPVHWCKSLRWPWRPPSLGTDFTSIWTNRSLVRAVYRRWMSRLI